MAHCDFWVQTHEKIVYIIAIEAFKLYCIVYNY